MNPAQYGLYLVVGCVLVGYMIGKRRGRRVLYALLGIPAGIVILFAIYIVTGFLAGATT